MCLITNEAVDVTYENYMTRPRSAEPKVMREERYASQSGKALQESGNSIYDIAREYAGVFPDNIRLNFLWRSARDPSCARFKVLCGTAVAVDSISSLGY